VDIVLPVANARKQRSGIATKHVSYEGSTHVSYEGSKQVQVARFEREVRSNREIVRQSNYARSKTRADDQVVRLCKMRARVRKM
jgi:hypothetical protein